jgi:hypothetical protein
MSGSSNDSNSYDTTIEEDYEGGGGYICIFVLIINREKIKLANKQQQQKTETHKAEHTKTTTKRA